MPSGHSGREAQTQGREPGAVDEIPAGDVAMHAQLGIGLAHGRLLNLKQSLQSHPALAERGGDLEDAEAGSGLKSHMQIVQGIDWGGFYFAQSWGSGLPCCDFGARRSQTRKKADLTPNVPLPSGVSLMFAGFRSRWTMPFS